MKQVKHAGLYIWPCKEEQKKDLAHQVLYEAAGLRTQVPTKTRQNIAGTNVLNNSFTKYLCKILILIIFVR